MPKEMKSPNVNKMYGVQIIKETGGEDSRYCKSEEKRNKRVDDLKKGTKYRTIDEGVYLEVLIKK